MIADQWRQRLTVQVVDGKGKCVFAKTNIIPGETIGYFEGYEIYSNTMYSLSLEGKIIEATGILRNLSHSCDPNASFEKGGRWLYALKNIEKGTEVTIDYERTERILCAPFVCKCGSPNCRGVIGNPSQLGRQL
jgi:hypothetical protein